MSKSSQGKRNDEINNKQCCGGSNQITREQSGLKEGLQTYSSPFYDPVHVTTFNQLESVVTSSVFFALFEYFFFFFVKNQAKIGRICMTVC